MKIYCDYCGAQIDTAKNPTCPNCGGSYASDKELLDEKARVEKLNGIDLEKRQLEVERMKLENEKLRRGRNTNNAAKGCLVPIIVALCLFGVLFITILMFVIIEEETGSKSSKTTTATSKTGYAISMEPVEMPDIPDIKVPDIKVTTVTMPTVSVPEVVVPEIKVPGT